MGQETNLMELVDGLIKRWKLVAAITGASILVGLVVVLVLPKTYEAEATVFPVTTSTDSPLAEYAGLATLAGIDLKSLSATNSSAKVVNALLESRLLIERLIVELGLDGRIPTPGKTPESRHRALVRLLRQNLSVSESTKTGVLAISFEQEDPALAAQMTNRLVAILDALLAEKALTTNQKNRENLDRLIEEQGKKVSTFQRQLADFQTETSLLNPAAQAGRVLEAYTGLIQQRMELELQLATAQASYSPNNPRITLLQTQIKNLDVQIDQVKNQVNGDLPSMKMAPENIIRFQNLTRDLEIATKIYAGLLASVEQSKLESDKDQVYIEVLDRAEVPEKSDGKPKNMLIMAVSTVVGFLLALLVALALNSSSHRKEARSGQPL